ADFCASRMRWRGVPRVPISPRVRSTRPTCRPSLTAFTIVPPHDSSVSSACAEITRRSQRDDFADGGIRFHLLDQAGHEMLAELAPIGNPSDHAVLQVAV